MNNAPVTFINVFSVDPANQSQLVQILTQVTETIVRHKSGFISASLYRSIDGKKVTMHAQWESSEAYQAMRDDPAPRPYLEQALAIAKFEPGMYELARTFLPEASKGPIDGQPSFGRTP
jgi:quinol monooxygenase YgiN